MNGTREKINGSLEVNRMEIILSATYTQFKEVFNQIIIDEKEKQIFFEVVEEEVLSCFKGNGNICVQYSDEHCLYIFKAKEDDFKDCVFVKDTLTDNVYSYKFTVEKNYKVLH